MHRILLAALSLSLAAAPALAETFDRTVKSNSRTALGGFFSFDSGTCYGADVPDAKTAQAPANGLLQIVPHEQVLNGQSQCAGSKVRGLAFVYTPRKGFKGSDEVVIELPWTASQGGVPVMRSYHYRIRVE
jgi:hypothetical protein